MKTSLASENPFCSRRVRPGAVPFIFPPGQNPEKLTEHLRQNGWRGEIIGPHGSGKSTLLAALIPALERCGQRLLSVVLRDRQRRLPFLLKEGSDISMIVVDGYEQLSLLSRLSLRRFCRRNELGLLVAAHRSVGLPTLYQTDVTPRLAEQVVAELLDELPSPFQPDEVAQCLLRNEGNLREALFDLYDIYRKRLPT